MKVDLPFLAEGVEGGDVVQLLVREGDQVTEGQALLELETEKATVPVPSPVAGKVASLLVRQGDHVKVGQALVELESARDGAQPDKATAPAEPAAPQPPPAVEAAHAKAVEQREQPPAEQSPTPPVPSAPAERSASERAPSPGAHIPASPSVRRLARELGVDLAHVKGSEAGGRITADDVKAFVRERTRRSGAPSGDRRQRLFHDVRRRTA